MKELSKVPIIKKYINLDPRHPGTVSKQRYHYKNGRKSNVYYLWQSSILGQKKSIRIPKEEVAKVKAIIKSAKASTDIDDARTATTLKSYRKALDQLIERNREIRAKNGEKAFTKKQKEANKKKREANDKKIQKLEQKIADVKSKE